jgi:Zn-dependent peptidase ImmA (M78 family)
MTTTEFNIERLNYLLALYDMSKDELLSILNEGRKRLYTLEEINGPIIAVSLLKKIDEIFKKGLSFYLDFSDINESQKSKVLFRKKRFQSVLSIEDKRIVDSFESLKSLLDGYRTLTDSTNTEYKLNKVATIEQQPKDVANSFRSQLLPEKDIADHKQFLKAMIKKLADLNVYVFEFVETWNKREKATIDGFYLSPNVIVLKRQKYYQREIFTLAHEIGHYLLGVEDVESLDMAKVEKSRISNRIERWCNDFAFSLIAGEAVGELDGFKEYSEDLNQKIDELSSTTHISRMAWYTRLAYENIIPIPHFNSIIHKIEEEDEEKQRQLKAEMKLKSSRASAPRPIISPLYLETMQYAFYNGLVSESAFCEHLKMGSSSRSYLQFVKLLM